MWNLSSFLMLVGIRDRYLGCGCGAVHIDPMDWSILGRLSNPNTPPTSSSQSECSDVIMWIRYYMSS